MIAKFEERYFDEIKVWSGRYKNLANIAHWHKEAELIFIEQGSAQIGINREIFESETGDVFLCKSGDVHYINAMQDSIISILIFDTEIVRKILMKYSLLSPKIKIDIDISSFIQAINQELKEKKLFYKDKIYSLINGFIADIFRTNTIEKTSSVKSIVTSYQELLEFIDENYAAMTFSDAADTFGYSKSHFSRLFSNLTGKSFTDYLNSVRIEKAIEMILKNDAKIIDIAENCGFNSIRHFNRTFKKETGFVPTDVLTNPNFSFDNINPQKVQGKFFNPTTDISQLINT